MSSSEGIFRIAIEKDGEIIFVDRTKEEALYQARWGTYGPNGTDPLKYVRLIDCSTDHLTNILRTQHQIEPSTRYIINEILKMRNAA